MIFVNKSNDKGTLTRRVAQASQFGNQGYESQQRTIGSATISLTNNG